MALVAATAAWQACEFIGMPEARIILAQAATHVACAPKSNAACVGIDAALARVREERTTDAPNHLRDTHYRGAKRLGRGGGYKYPHDFPGGYTPQDYGVERGAFYHPTDRGNEARFRAYLESLDERDREEEEPASND